MGLLLRGGGAQGTPRHHRACSGPKHGIQHPKFSFLWLRWFDKDSEVKKGGEGVGSEMAASGSAGIS